MKMSNLPLPVHQHVLHSAVKCLPPQHVHSEMPHAVQSPHSVKTISNIIMEVKNGYNDVLGETLNIEMCFPTKLP